MNIASVGKINTLNNNISKQLTIDNKENRNAAFETLFDAAAGMIKDTNHYINNAEEAEMAFSLGLMDNTHDLQVAQQKANLALQYTIAVRNQVLDAYKEIMNLQF
ncbi:MAG: flagellar hook-basal body complex protein FliE [Clostridiales bacterium]|jgi:flagellar hook-basal body complex protein FliE|nr:flagellar hook-basal body complex protein FliE [Bacillota bacterium]NLK03438.1 flagellar hook-basal body complex protein FliE [Clostridiales bacterium]